MTIGRPFLGGTLVIHAHENALFPDRQNPNRQFAIDESLKIRFHWPEHRPCLFAPKNRAQRIAQQRGESKGFHGTTGQKHVESPGFCGRPRATPALTTRSELDHLAQAPVIAPIETEASGSTPGDRHLDLLGHRSIRLMAARR